MRLRRISLHAWRGVSERTVRFGHGITLIEGPNEAGKSTLIEALRLLLTEQHSSKKASVRAIQPAGQDVGSRVCAEFELGGRCFEYCKTFNRGGATELQELGAQPKQWAGREAHDQMTALLGEHLDLTLWQTLLVDQGAAIEQVALSGSPSLAQALDSASGKVSSPDQDRVSSTIYAAAQEVLETYYSPRNRKPRFSEEEQAIELLRRELADARSALTGLDEDLQLEARQLQQQEQLAAQLPALHDNAEAAAQQLAAARSFADQKLELTRQAAEAEGRLTELQRIMVARAERQSRLDSIERQLARTTAALTAAHEQQRPLTTRITAAEAELQRLRQQRSALELALDRAELEERLRVIEEQLRNFTRSLEQRHHLKHTLDTLDEQLAAEPMTAEALDTLRSAESALEISERTLELAATHYRLTASVPLKVSVDGAERSLDVGDTLEGAIVKTQLLELDAFAELSLEAPATLGEARARRDAAAATLSALRAQLQVTSLAAAVVAAEQRAAKAAERTAVARQLTELLNDQTVEAITNSIDRLREDQLKVHNRLQAAAGTEAPATSLDLAALREAIGTVDQQLKAQQTQLEALSAEQRQADASLRELEQQRIVDIATAAEQRRQIEEEVRQVSDADIEQRLETLGREASMLKEQLATLERRDSGISMDDATLLEQNASNALKRAHEQLEELKTALAVTRDRLERARADGRFERVQQLQSTLTAREEAFAAVERRARASLRLWDTLNRYRDAERSAYLAPLKAQLERLGRLVFGPDFGVSLADDWRITYRYLNGQSLPFDALSVGAQEQLSILLRLAAAQLVAPEGGIPLFLDDTLGYADPERLGAMTNAIALAADSCQIVILTCDPSRYARLGNVAVVQFER